MEANDSIVTIVNTAEKNDETIPEASLALYKIGNAALNHSLLNLVAWVFESFEKVGVVAAKNNLAKETNEVIDKLIFLGHGLNKVSPNVILNYPIACSLVSIAVTAKRHMITTPKAAQYLAELTILNKDDTEFAFEYYISHNKTIDEYYYKFKKEHDQELEKLTTKNA